DVYKRQGIISPKAISFSRNIYCFTEDEQGNIWMGSKWDGIIRLSPKRDGSFQIRNYVHKEEDPYSLSNNSVYCIYQDSKKRMWIATHGGGINLLQETANGKIRFLHNGNLLKGYSKDKFNKVRVIKEVNNALLVGTTEGLITFSCNFERPEDIKFYDNVRIPDLASSLSSNDVIYIYTDSHKNSYVLTFTGGINQIISDNLLTDHIQFKTYTKRNGLVSDLVLSMIEDQQRNLWVISENTLAKFDPENGTFEHYNEKHLQKEIYFSEASPAILQNQLILGTDAGILKINPTAFSKSSYTPPIVFTSLKIQGVQQQLDLDDLEELKLKPDERNVSFLFAALDYINPTSISYAYRLKGLEEKWNEVENSRTASYINLPPGNYELQIRSTNSDGVWTDNIRKLSVNVTPTFWETSWAILFYIISFILFTSTIVYIILYIYKLRHQIYMEQQLANVKLRFFTDISHELRTPLTLITSPVGEVLEHESLTPSARKLLTVVHNNTERMLRLVNQILDFRKIENKKMKLLLEKTDIVELLQKVMDNFRLIAEEKNINFRLQTDKESIHCWIDQDKVEKIIFNLLSNAFKYTPANKSITVYAHTTKDKVVISVADEGIGIDPKKQQTLFQRFETLVNNNILQPSSGIGLSLVKELIELHQGNIQVNTETGIGSEFIVTLPLDQKVYEGKENAEFILSDIPSTHNQKDSKHKAIFPIPEKKNILQENIAYCDVDDKTDEEFISVLIIEDNTELRSFLNDILSGTYKVIEATNGQEGLEQALQYIPDFIISDVMMPVMDGLDMVKAIKEQRDICHIPIILLSAKSSLDDRISGLEHGIDDYITKPFSSTYLKIRIKYLLQQRKQLQELYLKQWSKTLKKTPVPIADIEPTPPQITSFDEEFMKRVMEIMNNQMDNSDFIIDEFAKKLGMGRTVFYQKLKSLTGLSPIDFVREMRIKRAKQLAESGEYNVSTIAYMTGFNDPKYFSKCFKKRYGVSPSEFQNK
uniref:ATP-binding protein n=1 Tax=Bacteroides cellulosilyticus TaxID=246787 RepID=UPI0034A50665